MSEPVVLINAFHVPADVRGAYVERYTAVMRELSDKPGFLGGGLHAALEPDRSPFQFVNVNRWTSPEAFRAAIAAVDPNAVFGKVADQVEPHAALYRVVHHYDAAPGEDPIGIVRSYFEAAHRDEAALLALVAEDGVIDVPASLPYGGVHRGHDGFREALAGFARTWQDVETHDLSFAAAGDTVVALSRMTARAAATGQNFETRVAETFRVQEGRIVEVRPFYFDTAAMLTALGSRP